MADETEPWIDPNGDGPKEIIEKIRQCLSRVISHSVDGKRHPD
jgi:uncharacterized Fe-S cluster protein YjdI